VNEPELWLEMEDKVRKVMQKSGEFCEFLVKRLSMD
jgi:hypothetical protein